MEYSLNNKRRTWVWDCIFVILLVAAFVFMLWKCRYGFANMDEAFYLTIPYRLCQGDGLLGQEWHLSQLSGFLLYPVMKLYLIIAGGITDGLFLTFRYIYTCVQLVAAVFIYGRLRNIFAPAAAGASLCFMLYAPFGIMALSYNSMGIQCLTISLIIMLTSKRARYFQYIVAGLFFAAAVLCCPYLILVYVVYFAAVIITAIVCRASGRKRAERSVFTVKSWLFFTIGAAILAAVFGVFVLSRTGISQILASLPSIMNDPSHESKGAIGLIVTYFTSVMSVSKAAVLCYAIEVAVAVIAAVDRKKNGRRAIYFAICALCTVVAVFYMVHYGNYINYVMYPINIMAFACALICWNDCMKRILFTFWAPAMLYTLCMHASSNMEYYAISSGATVAVVGSVMIIGICGKEIFAVKGAAVKAAAAIGGIVIITGQLATVGIMRYKAVFWGSMDILLPYQQEAGLEKGLYIPEAAEEQCKLTQEISDYIETNYPGEMNMAVLSDYTWLYLQCQEKKNASCSAWLAEVASLIGQNTMDKLKEYYKLNPDKIPDIVYMEKDYTDFLDDFQEVADYDVSVLELNDAYILERVG